MPTYPHYCKRCNPEMIGEPIEIELKLDELKDRQACIVCGSDLTRVIAANQEFQLKGPGWANMGYTKQHPPVAQANAGRPSRRDYK